VVKENGPYPVLLVGGGMISREVVLPTLFQLQRHGEIAGITVCTRRAKTSRRLREEFPERAFRCLPDASADAEQSQPGLYRQAIEELPAGGIVVVATPDPLHTPVVLHALEHGHHCVVEKPLCLNTADLRAIRQAAEKRG
jgi:predicted dehydrogenase